MAAIGDYLRSERVLSEGSLFPEFIGNGRISLEGYPHDLDNPYSDKSKIRNFGYPVMNGKASKPVRRPKTDNSRTANEFLEDHFDAIAECLNEYLRMEGGIEITDFGGLTIREMEGDGIIRTPSGIKGIILGYYNTKTKDLYLNHRLTKEGKKYTGTHEVVHFAQDIVGFIGTYLDKYDEQTTRDYVEDVAQKITKKVAPRVKSRQNAAFN